MVTFRAALELGVAGVAVATGSCSGDRPQFLPRNTEGESAGPSACGVELKVHVALKEKG